jgi:hypothetical protein
MTMQFRFGYSKGRVVGVESGPDGQPEADLDVLMGGVVVDDQMNVQFRRNGQVDVLEEVEKLLMPVVERATP